MQKVLTIVLILFVYSAPGGGNAVNLGQVCVDKGLKSEVKAQTWKMTPYSRLKQINYSVIHFCKL